MQSYPLPSGPSVVVPSSRSSCRVLGLHYYLRARLEVWTNFGCTLGFLEAASVHSTHSHVLCSDFSITHVACFCLDTPSCNFSTTPSSILFPIFCSLSCFLSLFFPLRDHFLGHCSLWYVWCDFFSGASDVVVGTSFKSGLPLSFFFFKISTSQCRMHQAWKLKV